LKQNARDSTQKEGHWHIQDLVIWSSLLMLCHLTPIHMHKKASKSSTWHLFFNKTKWMLDVYIYSCGDVAEMLYTFNTCTSERVSLPTLLLSYLPSGQVICAFLIQGGTSSNFTIWHLKKFKSLFIQLWSIRFLKCHLSPNTLKIGTCVHFSEDKLWQVIAHSIAR